MASMENHAKLGLFVLTGLAITILAGSLFGAALLHKDTVRYHSYFNESVQGLDVGSPVKFRGVTIGNVAAIEIAPDHRMVDVVSELDTKDVTRMGLTEAGKKHGERQFSIPPDLRAQLGSQGITGVKFIAIDFFDEKQNPPPVLPFPTPAEHYIPAAPSMMKNLEDSITTAMDRLPAMVDAVVMIMARVDKLLASVQSDDIPGKAAATLTHADGAMVTLQAALARIDKQDVGGKAATAITDLTEAVAKMSAAIDRLDGDKGLFASAQHATDGITEIARAGRGTQKDLEETLRDVADAAEAIRSLVTAIERDPEMLIKGKTKSAP